MAQISFTVDTENPAHASIVAAILALLTAASPTKQVAVPVAAPVAPAVPVAAPVAPVAPRTPTAAEIFGGIDGDDKIPFGSAGTPPSPSIYDATPAETDRDGLVWDARIHSESKAKVADGTWRKRRNLAPGVYEQVVAELRGLSVPAAPIAPIAPAAPVAPAVQVAAPVAPITPAAPVMPHQPPASAEHSGNVGGIPAAPIPGAMNYRQIMEVIISAQTSRGLTREQVNQVLKDHAGTDSALELLSKPETYAAIRDAIDALATKVAA